MGLGPDARLWPREGGGIGASLLIYLLPWHSPWVGAPPRAGTDGVPGSQQCLSSLGHLPGKTAFVTSPGSHKGRDLEKLRPSRVVGAEGAWLQVLCLCAQTLFLSHLALLSAVRIRSLPHSTSSILSMRSPWSKPLFSTRVSLAFLLGPVTLSLWLKISGWDCLSSVLPTTLHSSQRMVIISFAFWENLLWFGSVMM